MDASRKRMGLSQHVLSLIEKTGALNRQRRADSSELDDQRCKFNMKVMKVFYVSVYVFVKMINSEAILLLGLH